MPIRLGDKPLSEMSESEMMEAVDALRQEREALRAEAIKKSREQKAAGVTVSVAQPRKPRVTKTMDTSLANTLAFLTGEKDAL